MLEVATIRPDTGEIEAHHPICFDALDAWHSSATPRLPVHSTTEAPAACSLQLAGLARTGLPHRRLRPIAARSALPAYPEASVDCLAKAGNRHVEIVY